MKLLIGMMLIITSNSYAALSGKYYSEFKRSNSDCAIEANITQKNSNQITFKQWDELCEDQNGNSYESSLGDVMTYEKVGDKKLKVTAGKDTELIDAKILEYSIDNVHYNFEVDTEDGHLEINESFKSSGDSLDFSSVYILDGKVIINKSGTIQRKK